MKKRIVFIAKTNLNNDGRILNQIKILQDDTISKELDFDFILLPDKPLKIDLGAKLKIHDIKTFFRNNKVLRFLTVFEFTMKSLLLLFKLKPTIIHAQDTAVVLPVYLYKIIKRNKVIVIYDDHEMPNEQETLQMRIFHYFELKLIKISNLIIFANQERQEVLQEKHDLKNKSIYFLNLPYFEKEITNINNERISSLIDRLNGLHEKGYKIIMHQGSLEYERGREKLANFSRITPDGVKILIIGVSEDVFECFLKEYSLDGSKFVFEGFVDYFYLNNIWRLVDASIIMYLPTYINNRLCAPNRYFIALKNHIPTIVNKDNPVLYNYSIKYESGFFIEDIQKTQDFEKVFSHSYQLNIMQDMIKFEVNKFLDIYSKLLS